MLEFMQQGQEIIIEMSPENTWCHQFRHAAEEKRAGTKIVDRQIPVWSWVWLKTFL